MAAGAMSWHDAPRRLQEAIMQTRRTATITAERIAERIRREFLALPGLRLSLEQAERVWGLDPQACAALLDSLVSTRFLAHEPDGSFRRADVPPREDLRLLPGGRGLRPRHAA